MKRLALSLAVLSLAAAPLAAQNQFRADLDGGQENPPVITSAGGWGTATLNANNTITYNVRTYGLTGTFAHIHEGAVGVNGGILFTLSGGPTTYSGTTAALTATQIATLRAGGMYFNVHTSANPGGEIRGQILISPRNYAATLQGSQENPPVVTGASGTGTAVLNADNTVTYNVTTSGLTGTAAHIHTGAPGVNGGILFTLAGGPTMWSGTTAALSATQMNDLQAGNLYFNVHTSANPGGEIRGQITRVGLAFGQACPWSGGTATLTQTGAPYAGGTIALTVAGGQPGDMGVIEASLTAIATVTNNCPYFLQTPLIRSLPVTLNAGGTRTINVNLPNVAGDVNVFAQFTGTEGATTYRSAGMALLINKL